MERNQFDARRSTTVNGDAVGYKICGLCLREWFFENVVERCLGPFVVITYHPWHSYSISTQKMEDARLFGRFGQRKRGKAKSLNTLGKVCFRSRQ